MFAKALGTLSLMVVMAGVAAYCWAQGDGQSQSHVVQQLLTERVETLRGLVERYELLYRGGKVSLHEYANRVGTLVHAELELAENGTKRIELLEAYVAKLKDCEAMLESAHQNGMSPEYELLDAKALRLAAQIDLAKEQERR